MRTWIVLLICFFCLFDLEAKNSVSINLNKLKMYVESLQPSFILEGGISSIPRLEIPPDSINDFLLYCIENNIKESYKYAFLAVLKLKLAYRNGEDYDFCDYHSEYNPKKNGLIELVLHVMNYEYDTISCAFIHTYDVYKWVKSHRKIYKDYKPLFNCVSLLKVKVKPAG